MTDLARNQAKPFPFATLESLSRADVERARRQRAVARDFVDLDGLEAALSELVSEPVRISLRHHRRLEAPRGMDDAAGVVLAFAGEASESRRVLVEVEGALAVGLTARALRQRVPRLVDQARSPSPALTGALAAVVLAAVRRAHAGAAAKVIAAGPGAQLARDLLLAERDVTTTTLTVRLGEDAFEAHVSVPDTFAPAPRHARLSHAALARMGDAAIRVPLVVATSLASRSELAALAKGDAFVPANPAFAVQHDGSLVGPVALVAPRAERGLSADLAADGRLVVRGLLELHPWESERSMPSEPNLSPTQTATVEVLEEAPVVVRVELGSVEMTAREWAALGAGDVVALGRRVGDPAILRVGGAELARGELVQVEGEYAVRILARGAGP